mmetsp:Transcript_25045/g.70099  ORF Transcript_25045/g.70099 Transcript_25045/m.70099 type:complete len:459 (+) Transcript_25045:182-1558(+)
MGSKSGGEPGNALHLPCGSRDLALGGGHARQLAVRGALRDGHGVAPRHILQDHLHAEHHRDLPGDLPRVGQLQFLHLFPEVQEAGHGRVEVIGRRAQVGAPRRRHDRRAAGQALDHSGAQQPAALVVVQRGALVQLAGLVPRQLVRQDVGVLHGLAAPLPEVGLHGVRGVPEQRGGAVHPPQRRRPVKDVATLDVFRQGGLDAVEHLRAPALEQLHELLLHAPLARAPVRALVERVELRLAVADVGRHEVLAVPQEHLVAHRVHVIRLELARGRVARVPAVGGTVALALHLGPDGAPDPVRPHQHVADLPAAVGKDSGDPPVGQVLVAHAQAARLHHAGAEPLVEDVQQGVAVDHEREGQAVLHRGLARVEPGVPLPRLAVQQPVHPVPRDGAHLHDLLRHPPVHRLHRRQRVALDLDRPPERLVLLHLLKHAALDPALLQCQGRRQAPDAPAGHQHP